MTKKRKVNKVPAHDKTKCCENCLRRDCDQYGERLERIDVVLRSSEGFHWNKKLCMVMKEEREYVLCNECFQLVRDAENVWLVSWPAYLWNIFSDPLNVNKLHEMWKYVPESMRAAWVVSYQSLECGTNIFQEEPKAYFEDITKEAHMVEKLKSSGKLVDLIRVCNDYLCYCSIKCPWGCTDFVDNCGYISYQDFLIRMLKVNQPIKGIGKKNVLFGINGTYMTTSPFFMNNSKWPVRRAVVFVPNRGFCVCTCKDHNGGSDKRYVHPPTNPMNGVLPMERSDQLAHAVLNPRTIKSLRTGKYNDIYQMYSCRGSFRGLDTCDIVDVGNFSYTTTLEGRNRALILYGRSDLRQKMQQLVETKRLPSWFAEEELINVKKYRFQENNNIQKGLDGSTYVPLLDAIAMGQENMMETLCDDINKNGMEKKEMVEVISSWPSIVPMCYSSNDTFENCPLQIPTMKVKGDCRLLWFIMSLGCHVPAVWKCMCGSVSRNSDMAASWIGWVLKTITAKILGGVTITRKKNMLPYVGTKSFKQLMEFIIPLGTQHHSMFTWEQLALCLSNINGIHVFLEGYESFFYEVQNDTLKMKVSSNTNVVIAIKRENETTELGKKTSPLVTIKINNEDYVLVYIGASKSDGTEQRGISWNCTIIMRYMQNHENSSWWQISRDGQCLKLSHTSFSDVVATLNYGILLYEKKEKQNETDVRLAYMKCLGGQITCKCPHHQQLLVVCSLEKGNKKCVVEQGNKRKQCSGVVGYCCPMIGCKIYTCRKHVKDNLFNIIGAENTWDEEINNSENFQDVDRTNNGQKDENIDDEDDYEKKYEDNFGDDYITESNRINSFETVLNSMDENNVCESAENIEETIQHVINDDGENNGALKHEEFLVNNIEQYDIFPTTVASVTRGVIIKPSSKNKMPLHVLLNEHGCLLIRRNQRMPRSRKVQGYLETIVSTTKGESIPLIYPEGMLFPSIFWHQQQDGSIDGALPVALFDSNMVATNFGYANIESHMRSRLKNSSSLCSTDPRYIFFAFDCINNLKTRGYDNRIILQRGFEHMLGPGEINGFMDGDSMLASDLLDSRRNVYKLAAIIRWREPTYFYTHTCNQSKHFGIAPLYSYLQELLLQVTMNATITAEIKREYTAALHQTMMMQITRTWLKVAKLYMNYIFTSEEHPLGVVLRYWWRFEYQDAEGNLPHLHGVLCTAENKTNPKELETILNRIRCSSTTFISPQEAEQYVSEGLLPDASSKTIEHVLDMINTILPHSCSAAHFRCCRQVGPNKEDLQCRRVDYYKENPHHGSYGYRKINPHHSSEAIELFQELGLLDENGYWTEIQMEAGQFMYPANAGEHLSPCNPRLFIAHGSCDNLQACDPYLSARYLSKYVQSLDENRKVEVKSARTSPDFKLEEAFIANTKIASGHYYEEKRIRNMKEKIYFVGRAVALTEAIALLFQEPQVFTNQTFVNIPTVPLEQRVSIEKHPRSVWVTMDTLIEQKEKHYSVTPIGTSVSKSIARREELNLPEERQHSNLEKMIISDALQSPILIDSITVFGCRPPELRFIENPTSYFQYFTRVSTHHRKNKKDFIKEMLQYDLKLSGWIDGLDKQILIKPAAIANVMGMQGCSKATKEVLRYLYDRCFCNSDENGDNNIKYVDPLLVIDEDYTMKYLPLPIYNIVQPSQTNRFLIHLLLSMGSYSNEAELFARGSMKNCFKRAKLLPNEQQEVITIEDIKKLVKRFILTQLLFIPSGTRDFDCKCIEAFNSCKSILLEDSSSCIQELPSYLYSTLVMEANQNALQFHQEMKSNLARGLATLNNVPNEYQLCSATRTVPLQWSPSTMRIENQSIESFHECQNICKYTTGAIDLYCTANPFRSPKSIIICGGPGTGKTYQLRLALTYAMAKGLNVAVTALISERSNILGGLHVHHLFCIPGNNHPNINRIVDLTILALNRSPERLHHLRTLDVLGVDELGSLSGKLFNIMDTVMRFIRGNSSFMGGVLVLGTLDPLQMGPIHDYPLLLSSLALTSFNIIFMNQSIRGRNDPAICRLITISRKMNVSEEELKEFEDIIINQCRHVDSFDDPLITQDVIHLFGTRAAVKIAEEKYYAKITQQGITILERQAETFQSYVKSHTSWKPATSKTIKELNHIVNEREVLYLHNGLIVELTFNRPTQWSHGQMGMIVELPTSHQLQKWDPIKLMLAPVGVTTLPSTHHHIYTKEDLLVANWKQVLIGAAPEREHRLSAGLIAKRKQYGICPRHAMTIHKAMGSEFGAVATTIGHRDTTNNYRLWQREQGEVILSRTKHCKDLIFVGNKQDTARYLSELLLHSSPYTGYMMHFLSQIEHENQSPPVIQPSVFLPFHLKQVESQLEDFGSVYLLLSLATKCDTYIGQTGKHLHVRVKEHNSGYGATDTSDPKLRPWFPIAFVTGFGDDSERERRRFERCWQQLRYSIGQGILSPLKIIQLGEQLIGKWETQNTTVANQLKMVRCIQFRSNL